MKKDTVRKYRRILDAILYLSLTVIFSGCDLIKGLSANEEGKIQEAYIEYYKAIQAGDIESLKKLVAKEKIKELEEPEAADMLAMVRAFYPDKSNITSVKITGEAATITLSGRSKEGNMQGTVNLVKEDGIWKVSKEDWEIKMGMDIPQQESSPVPDTSKPFEYHKVIGTWKGHEAGRTSDDWEFTFGENYEVSVKNAAGQSYSGTAMSDWNLGLSSGSLRVLRGGAIFDIRISDASDAKYVGKISLGSYKLMGDTLQICGGEPGLMKRTSDFASTGGIRCFELTRAQP